MGIVVRCWCSQSTAYVGPQIASCLNLKVQFFCSPSCEVSEKTVWNPTNKVGPNKLIFEKHISEMPFAVGQQAPVWFFFAQAGIAAQSLEDAKSGQKFQQKGTSGWEGYR